jgi:hypothetical protein
MKIHYTWVEPKGQGNSQNVRLDLAVTVIWGPASVLEIRPPWGVFTLRYGNSSHPTRWASMHPRHPILFLRWRWWVLDFLVPNVFPNMFTLLCPIWFALTSTLVTYISSPKEETTTVYIYLGTFRSLIKFSVLGESKVPITKGKNCTRGFGGSTQLINMSHTLYHYKIQRRNGNNKHNRENWGSW